ncbi:MAG: hypothetical protein LUE64_04295 [Candidatus Gastranaerophilales bacterium]|nr:hypothetical protein [Candidatus Gastranaerophilales bacterium]
MVQEGLKLFALYDKLQELFDEGFHIIPSHLMVVKSKELSRVIDSFPDAIDEGIKMAKLILRNKEEMIQDAKNKAERIIQDAQDEKRRILDESALRHEMEEQAKAFREKVLQECENIKMKAFGEAEGIRIASNEEALKMKDGAQAYAQQILGKLEQDLNSLFQVVKNGQQYISELRNVNDETEMYQRNEQQRR